MEALKNRRAVESKKSGESGRQVAAHICRGHFKQYTEASKLFGRLAGRFFWGQQFRVATSRRDVQHDYQINTKGISVKNVHQGQHGNS